ncbi:acetyl-CoA carboxylase biotin carboxyl carrier protein [Micromonospora sp. NPDC126480]|uniref:acetyl-CoA carboxylase biotin carboxyl carrier protein n=1 Tax=Micromonospora sp. NPDC126480 TaxID=3155312 RepID=UPI00332BD858
MNSTAVPAVSPAGVPAVNGGPGGGPAGAGRPAGTGVEAGGTAALAELRRQARELLAEIDGPVRRVRLSSGEAVLELEWHPTAARPAPAGPPDPPSPAQPPPQGAARAAAAPERHAVRSPIVGTFYRAPEPGAAPFVAVGDRVHPGQVVGIVEAMKLMNEVTTDRAGRVAEIHVDDGQPVEYDQTLLALDPA